MKKSFLASAALLLSLGRAFGLEDSRNAAPVVDCTASKIPGFIDTASFQALPISGRNFADVIYSVPGKFTAADAQGDGLANIDADGTVTSFDPLNLLPFNLAVSQDRVFFSAFDASGNSKVGYRGRLTIAGQLLPGAFFNQGGAMAVMPEGTGLAISYGLSVGEIFHKDYLAALTPVTFGSVQPLRVAPNPAAPNFVLATRLASGFDLKTVSYQGVLTDGPMLPGGPNFLVPCGDGVWAGGVRYLSWITFPGGQPTISKTFPSTMTFFAGACGQNGNIFATGSGRTISRADLDGFHESYTVQGTGDLLGIALGPGKNVYGLLLDVNAQRTVGSIIKFQIPIQFNFDRSSASGCRPNEFNLRIVNQF